MKKRYSEDTILLVVKPLFNLAEAGNYWFAIYLDYHKKKLGREILLYDIYLFITKDGGENFGIVGLQTDNIFNVGMEAFIKNEEIEIMETKFKAKTRTIFETSASEDFNGCRMTIKAEFIMIIQKNQVEKLIFINIKDNAKKQ